VVLRADDDAVSTTGNFLLDQLAGASYEILPSAQWGRGVKEAFGRAEAACLEAGRPALLIPTGGSDSLGIWGYIAAAEELRGDLITAGIDRAAVALATGSAGTQTGLTAGAVLHELPVSVVGYAVCDDSDWFNVRVSADWRASVLRWPQLPDISLVPNTRDHSVGPGYGRADPAIYALIAELTRLEGIPLDPVYTGKAFHGLITDIEAGHYDGVDDIVFLHTGGIFGLFSHEAQLLRATASASVTH
jgi:D-cysteine desulfhydrase